MISRSIGRRRFPRKGALAEWDGKISGTETGCSFRPRARLRGLRPMTRQGAGRVFKAAPRGERPARSERRPEGVACPGGAKASADL
jgi:hypothetical protein